MRSRDPYQRSSWTASARRWARAGGAALLVAGLALALVGFGSFFASFGTFQPPRYFWCAFIGLPLLSIGISLLRAGFLGAATEYVADEVAPTLGKVADHILSAAPVASDSREERVSSTSDRLRRLDGLRTDGLISPAEYERKRAEIIADL